MKLTQILYKYLPDWYHMQKTQGGYFKKQSLFYLTRYYRNIGWSTRKNALNRYHYFLEGENYFMAHNSRLRTDNNRARIAAACDEHNYKYRYLISTLPKINIHLSISSLARLAIYEPKSFKALVDISRNMTVDNLEPANFNPNRLEMEVKNN